MCRLKCEILLIRSSVRSSFIYSLTHSFADSFTHSFIYSFIHSLIHWLIDWFIHSFIYWLIHSLLHSLVHSPVWFKATDQYSVSLPAVQRSTSGRSPLTSFRPSASDSRFLPRLSRYPGWLRRRSELPESLVYIFELGREFCQDTSYGRPADDGKRPVNRRSRLEWSPAPVSLCRTTPSIASRCVPPANGWNGNDN